MTLRMRSGFNLISELPCMQPNSAKLMSEEQLQEPGKQMEEKKESLKKAA